MLKSRRRSKLELNLCVLRVIQDGTSQITRIMHASNQCYVATQQILLNLVESGYVTETKVLAKEKDRRSTKRFDITPKGESVVNHLVEARALLNI